MLSFRETRSSKRKNPESIKQGPSPAKLNKREETATLENKEQSGFATLPNELVAKIASYIPLKSIPSFASVNKRFKAIVDEVSFIFLDKAKEIGMSKKHIEQWRTLHPEVVGGQATINKQMVRDTLEEEKKLRSIFPKWVVSLFDKKMISALPVLDINVPEPDDGFTPDQVRGHEIMRGTLKDNTPVIIVCTQQTEQVTKAQIVQAWTVWKCKTNNKNQRKCQLSTKVEPSLGKELTLYRKELTSQDISKMKELINKGATSWIFDDNQEVMMTLYDQLPRQSKYRP